MAFWQHMEALRQRLLWAVIGVAVGSVLGLALANPVLRLLLAPMGPNRPVALHPTEAIGVYFRVAFMLGLVLAMPIILYQLLRFVVPGLTSSERRLVLTAVIAAGLFFALGVAFAGGVMLPLAIGYLRGFMGDLVLPTYSIGEYVSFATTLMVSSGLVFQTPLVLALLARLGLVTAGQLARGRRVAVVVIAVLAGVITPTPDAFNMLLVMAPLLVLYEVGIGLAWLAGRARQRALASAGA